MGINISKQYVNGTCDLKCDYNFKYHNSNSIATNMGTSIQVSYEDSGVPPVSYNNIKYNVFMIQIVYPSTILYNDTNALGNILIQHSSVKDKSILEVIIPFFLSENTTIASDLISQIIQSVSTSAPNQNENVTLNLQDFSLQHIVPKKPFYSTGIGNFFDFILYDLEYAIPMSQSTYNTLTSIINMDPGETPQEIAILISDSPNDVLPLFYNSKGPNRNSSGDDDIYISCQPTGNSKEEKNVSFKKEKNATTTFDTDFKSLLKNPYFVYFFYSLIFIILLVFLSIIINMISSSHPIKIPFMSKKQS